jgi:poly(A) polymerase
MRFINLPRMRPARVRRFLGADDFPLHLALHEADCRASHGDMSIASFCREQLAAYAEEPVLPAPLLRGRDLVEMGYAPGPAMGEVLAWLREEQLDGKIADREDAVRRVRERWPLRR